MEPLNSKTCPLCGGPNGCGLKDGIGACWCADTAFSKDALARVPAELRNKTCICRACATEGAQAAVIPG